MLLALLFTDAALSASESGESRIVSEQAAGGGPPASIAAAVSGHAWTPRVENWRAEEAECPIFFQREVEGFGVFRMGPRCAQPDDYPHAL
jgi:hypothetical protein